MTETTEMIESMEHPLEGASSDLGQVPAHELSMDELLAEMASLHRARHDVLRYDSAEGLRTHLARTAEIETEYLWRFPEREVDPARTR